MNYTQLTQEQRYQIYALLKMGHNQTEIAAVIGTHKSTVSRELGRNKGLRGYRPKQAHHQALSRRRHSRKRISEETWELIETKLQMDWSPEQVSGWLRRHHAIQISHEWIYQYILADKQAGGDLYRHLRCQKKRRKRYGSYDRRGKLPNRVREGEWRATDRGLGSGYHHRQKTSSGYCHIDRTKVSLWLAGQGRPTYG